MPVNEDFKKVVDTIKYKYSMNQSQIAEVLGVKKTYLSDMVNGRVSYNDVMKGKIIDAFPLVHELISYNRNSDESIVTDKSVEMFSIPQPSPVPVTSVSSPSFSFPRKTSDKGCGVPYYNVDFIGGFDLVLNDQTVVPEYYIDFKKYNSADCWCNVTGHSMEPEINPGDIIALKELEDWRTYMPAGEIYGIVTTEHRTIKKVRPSDREGYIRLIPINRSPEYTEQDIPISIIIKVYKVLGCVKRL